MANKPELPSGLPPELAKVFERLQTIGEKSASFSVVSANLTLATQTNNGILMVQAILGSAPRARALADALLDYADTVDEAFALPEPPPTED